MPCKVWTQSPELCHTLDSYLTVVGAVQVYTAEEKAALAMFNMEENKRKEQKILGDMQRLVQRTIGEVEEEAEAGSDEEEETKNQ